MMHYRLRTLLTRATEALLVVAIIVTLGWMLASASRESRKSAEEGAKAHSHP